MKRRGPPYEHDDSIKNENICSFCLDHPRGMDFFTRGNKWCERSETEIILCEKHWWNLKQLLDPQK